MGVLLGTAVVLLAVWIHRHALLMFFSPDDLILLERFRGIAAQPVTLWRAISGFVYYQLTVPVFGVNPVPYHVVGLALHAANALLLFMWIRIRGGAPAGAFLGASLFAASPMFASVVWQMSAIGEQLAAAFTLGALIACEKSGRVPRVIGAMLFAFALLSKESVALVPLAVLIPGQANVTTGERWRRTAPLLSMGALMWIYVLLSRSTIGSLGGGAYDAGLGNHVIDNVLTYAAWSSQLGNLETQLASTGDAASRLAGAVGLAIFAAMAALSWRHTRVVAAGLAIWACGLLPVLPLKYHTYAHYTYLPFAGWAAGIAAGFVWLVGSAGGADRAGVMRYMRSWAVWSLVLAGVALHAVRANQMFERRLQERIPSLNLPRDSMLRKMEFARNFTGDLGRAIGGAPVEVLVLSPPRTARVHSVQTGKDVSTLPADAQKYDFMTEVLDGGRAVRAIHPQVTSIRFEDTWCPECRAHLLTTNTVDGHVQAFGRGPAAHVELAEYWAGRGLGPQALEHLDDVLASWPGSVELQLAHAKAALRWGEREAGRRSLERLQREHPETDAGREAARILANLPAASAK